MSLEGRSLVCLRDLSVGEVESVLNLAERMAEAIGFDDPTTRAPFRPLDCILATLFYEPSTRTRLSFEAAMLRLGGQVLGFSDPSISSVRKGESLADTVRMASGYSDIIVIRHPLAGAARVAADYASVPVINAGDGSHEHPTQTLTDLFCIRRRKGGLSGLVVGLCGDLKYGRTVHSLAPAMARFGSEIVCISPPELRMPSEVLQEIERISGRRPQETAVLEEVLPCLDVIYMTRVQQERFERPEHYERVRGTYALTPEVMGLAKEDAIVLHPLPRVDEIAPEVDEDPRAAYFEQAAGGVPVRMALISLLLGIEETPSKGRLGFGRGRTRADESVDVTSGTPSSQPVRVVEGVRCGNPRCITSTEQYLSALVYERDGELRCAYCEEKVR